jgi:hypothetical protein
MFRNLTKFILFSSSYLPNLSIIPSAFNSHVYPYFTYIPNYLNYWYIHKFVPTLDLINPLTAKPELLKIIHEDYITEILNNIHYITFYRTMSHLAHYNDILHNLHDQYRRHMVDFEVLTKVLHAINEEWRVDTMYPSVLDLIETNGKARLPLFEPWITYKEVMRDNFMAALRAQNSAYDQCEVRALSLKAYSQMLVDNYSSDYFKHFEWVKKTVEFIL